MLQKLAISGQYDALLANRELGDLRIVERLVQVRVEAEHTQVACECRQMGIDDESRRAQGTLSHTQQRRDVEGFELWIHTHSIALTDQM